MKILRNKRIRSLFVGITICIVSFCFIAAIFMIYLDKNAGIPIFISALCMALSIIIVCIQYFLVQQKMIAVATEQITDYIAGNRNARIECNEEGELYLLFHKVNSLAAILNAQVDKEEGAKESLKNTIADISHQLKTPLAALNIYNGILQGEAESIPTIQEFTSLSEQELDRIEILVQNLLKITKFDVGTIQFQKKEENVFDMMDQVLHHFIYRIKQEGKEICLEGDKDITLFCDKNWLTEAIDNIVKNALDHTKKGDKVEIEWKQFATVIQIVIKDNGSGIHTEDLHFIFKRFYRSRFSKDTHGIGLGLPLSKMIVEVHNGMIEVDSELGVGTSFIINFLIPTKL